MLVFAGISLGAFLLAELYPQTTEVSSKDETVEEFQEENNSESTYQEMQE